MIRLTLIGKPDCHLCEVASDVIDTVIAGLPDALAEDIEIAERSILDDPALYEQYWEKIPVLLIDDEMHGHWRISPDRLRQALAAKATTAAVKATKTATAAEGAKA